MNYTSARYDAPFESRGNVDGAYSMSAGTSMNIDNAGSSPASPSTNLAGLGTHNHGHGHFDMHAQQLGGLPTPHYAKQHGYNSSGDMDFHNHLPLLLRTANASKRPVGPARPTLQTQLSQSQGSSSASHIHRRAQQSDDYDALLSSTTSTGSPSSSRYPALHQMASTSSLATSFSQADTDVESAFDHLVSPTGSASNHTGHMAGLAANTMSSQANPPFVVSPLPSATFGGMKHPAGQGSDGSSKLRIAVNRPPIGRSQTAGPIPTPNLSGRAAVNGSLFAHQQTASSAAAPLTSPMPSQSQTGIHSTSQSPPGAISTAALVAVVLGMRGGNPGQLVNPVAETNSVLGDQTSVAMRNVSPMARSYSANSAPSQQSQQQINGSDPIAMSNIAHTRNVSTGSTGSHDGETNHAEANSSMGRASSKGTAPYSFNGSETVVLSHHKIAEFPLEVINLLAGHVERLALSYNYLETLPPAMAKLGTTLRYLNIRLNNLTVFPAVLCELPSLEILDVSRNKIKRLPSAVGTLKNLRVFSIQKNRVKRLPYYFTEMTMLRVLKIDHNPLEWPPREIVTAPDASAISQSDPTAAKFQEAQIMQKWLQQMRDWMKRHAHEARRAEAPPLPPSRSDEIVPSRDVRQAHRTEPARTASPAQYAANRPGLRNTEFVTTPTSTSAALSSTGGASPQSISSKANFKPFASPEQIPYAGSPQREEILSPISPHSPDASRLLQHGRNASASLAASQTEQAARRSLKGKKSLPDLRLSHEQILDERMRDEAGDIVSSAGPTKRSIGDMSAGHSKTSSGSAFPPMPKPKSTDVQNLVVPTGSGEGPNNKLAADTAMGVNDSEHSPLGLNKVDRSRKISNALVSVPSAMERASGAYFRRVSMLPALAVSKAVPSILLDFMDAIRGILFSLSQIYSSLKQCVVFPAADRLPSSLTRIMASADDAMGFLIDALDRFDASSRRKNPQPPIIKDVIETCRENMTIFGKLVGALATNSSALFGEGGDVRYTRTLVVALYGAMGELSTSWSALTPLKEGVLEWLGVKTHATADVKRTRADSSASGPKVKPHKDISPVPVDEAGQISPVSATSVGSIPNKARPAMQPPLSNARRHAGSFTKYTGQAVA